MRSSTGYPHPTGWRAVFDPDNWIRALLVTATGVVSMALLACVVSLARDTTAHDWYATGKLTLAELLIGFGAKENAPVEYRTSRDEVLSLTRHDLTLNGNAWFARRYLLRTARKSAELGACCGLAGALLCLAVFRRQDRRWPQPPAHEPVSARPVPEQPQPAAPARAPPQAPPDVRPPRSTGPDADNRGNSRTATGNSGARSTTRRGRRTYGRWI